MFYHVLNRGNEKRIIFRDDHDCEAFLRHLGKCSRRFGLSLYAYVLMGNHYHLIVRTSQPNLSEAMHWLQMSYTIWHNVHHERSGHLFQGRFKAFLVQGESYLHRLILYVHRNPLRAGLAKRLRDYPWSSYPSLAYGRRTPVWFHPELTYRELGVDAVTLRQAIAGYDEQSDALWTELYGGLVLGSRSAVAEVQRRLGLAQDQETPQWRQVQSAVDLRGRIADYARRLQMTAQEQEDLCRPVRRRSRPRRDVLIYLLWSEGRYGLREIAREFHVSRAAVSIAKDRAEEYLRDHSHEARAWHISTI